MQSDGGLEHPLRAMAVYLLNVSYLLNFIMVVKLNKRAYKSYVLDSFSIKCSGIKSIGKSGDFVDCC